MNAIDKIEQTAPRFKLKTDRINKDMIKIYSDTFKLDSWMVEQRGYKLRLLHMSKKYIGNKCSYHLQREVKAKNWVWTLESITGHNRYVMRYKWNVRENLVDRTMRRYKGVH
jgi:hypothetical protein